MTEKKSDLWEESSLSKEEQMQLGNEEEFFRKSFSSFSCPPLPESLSAENIWNKICSGEGDHQVTVEPSVVEEQLKQIEETQNVSDTKTDSSDEKKMGEVLEFPKQRRTSRQAARRRWAIACTLVLVVGLSAAYWKIKTPMQQAENLMQDAAAAPQEESVVEEAAIPEEQAEVQKNAAVTEESAAEEPKAKAQTFSAQPTTDEIEETQQESEQVAEAEAVPQLASEAPAEQPSENEQQTEAPAEQPSENEQQTEAQPQTASIQPRVAMQEVPQSNDAVQQSPEVTELQQKILDSMSAKQQEEPEEELPATAQTQAAQPEKNLLQGAVKDAKQSQLQKFELKTGSVSYDPTSGAITLQKTNGEEAASMQVTAGAKVLASEKSMAVMEEDTEGGTVCIKLYSLEDISNPQEVRKVIHQGELFDFYQSPGNSYTLVTSVWFTKEQVEAGEFLPQVDGETVSASKVNVIEGYVVADRVNYNLTTTVTLDSLKTRVDLYLN